MIADTTIKRPALRYYGGKWNLAPWIISFFPPHKNYVEPCGGAASVLLQKPRSPLETYNDLDGNVVNFFRVLRDRPDELIRKIRLTPWARAEYELSLKPCEDEVERARRLWMALSSTVNAGNGFEAAGFRMVTCDIGKLPELANRQMIIEQIEKVSQRFDAVQIENRPAQDVIQRFDNYDALIYFDPPYIAYTRAQSERYAFEWSDADHIAAASLLRECAGYVVVSGYACPLYAELYEAHGWQRHDKEAQTNSGGKRIESVWLSPRTVEALNMPRQATLDFCGQSGV